MMKKILLTVSVFMILFSAKSQVAKGNWLLGGVLGYNSNNYSSGSSSNTNIAPRISYAVGINSVIGIKGEYSYSSSKDDGSSESNSNNISVNAFWRKYFALKNKFGWYAEASGGLNKGVTEFDYVNTNPDNKVTNKGYNLSLTPGIYYSATRSILLNVDFAGLSYYHATSESSQFTPQKTHSSNFSVRFLNYFSFGIDFIL